MLYSSVIITSYCVHLQQREGREGGREGEREGGREGGRCKERDGRDYSSYLSKKTLYNKAKAGSSRKSCPKCHRWFLRLDTHLKNSPFCKSVQQSDSQTPTAPTVPLQSDTPVNVSHHFTTNDSLTTETPPETNPPLKLPSSKEDWQVADSFFLENLVPFVHQATSAEEKNSILADGIYNYFATQYGVRQIVHRPSRKQKKDMKRQKHDRALKRVTELKNRARREFRQAKRQGSTREEIQSLARSFFDLV